MLQSQSSGDGRVEHNDYPVHCARAWHGMRMRSFLGLMRRNGWRVDSLRAAPWRYGMLWTVAAYAAGNSVLSRVQQLFYGRKIERTAIESPPVFIVGHWRSGTTWMHELLAADDRFAYPSTYACFVPHHFVLTEAWLGRAVWFLFPDRRPMDNMDVGSERPQEDEFALCSLGAPTPYYRIAFPNEPVPYAEFFDMEGVDPADEAQFREALLGFVRALTYRHRKPIVLKSTPHTGRIQLLAEMFPGAKFIHMVRDPYALFPSTKKTWQALDYTQGFQTPRHDGLDEFIFSTLSRMYRGFEKQRGALSPQQICDVRYEELVADPLAELERIYSELDLGDFAHVRSTLASLVESRKDYQPNRLSLDPAIKSQIDRRWADYAAMYGYAQPSSNGSAANGTAATSSQRESEKSESGK